MPPFRHAMSRCFGQVLPLLLLALAAAGTAASETLPPRIAPSEPGTAATTNQSRLSRRIDREHAVISSYVIGFGEGMDAWISKPFRDRPRVRNGRVDRFLNDPRAVEDTPASRMKVTPVFTLREADGFDAGIRVSGKLRLPRLADRLELIFDSEYDDNEVDNEVRRQQRPQLAGDQDGAAALRYYLQETLNFKASIDAGLKFKPEPVPRLSLRLRGYRPFEMFTARIGQSFFWETQDGFGTRAQLDLEQQTPQVDLRRLTTGLLWSEDSDGVQASEYLSYFRFLTKRRVLGGRIGLTGHLEPDARVDNYTVRFVYRQRVHREWLFLEIEPGVDWPRDRNYEATPFVNVKFDIIFGDWEDRSTGH